MLAFLFHARFFSSASLSLSHALACFPLMTLILPDMFPDMAVDALQAVLDSCNGNVEAAVEVLLGQTSPRGALMHAESATAQFVQIRVPPGLSAGQEFEFLSPSGQPMRVCVPVGVRPGDEFVAQLAPAQDGELMAQSHMASTDFKHRAGKLMKQLSKVGARLGTLQLALNRINAPVLRGVRRVKVHPPLPRPSNTMIIIIKNGNSGACVEIECSPLDTIGNVKAKFLESQASRGIGHFKLVCSPQYLGSWMRDGSDIQRDERTLADYNIESGSTLHASDHFRGDIGEWLPPSDVERHLLVDAHAATNASPTDVAKVVAAAAGPPPPPFAKPLAAIGSIAPFLELSTPLLDGPQRAQLVEHIELQLNSSASPDAPRDLKLDIADDELGALVGTDAIRSMLDLGKQQLQALGADPAAVRATFKLRRRAALKGTHDEVVPFHRDSSLVVVNVALNDDFEGGHLLFALDGRIMCPTRRAGSATAHDCRIVHGVSCLTAGIRYNLYAVYERPGTAAAA